jgi:uncharacterized protein
MMNALSHHALTEDELDQLDYGLATLGPTTMSLESLDGFLVALICGPEVITPDEYLPLIWGDENAGAYSPPSAELLELINRHWSAIADTLRTTVDALSLYWPILSVAEDGIIYGNDWALGFLCGVSMRLEAWDELLQCDEFGGPLALIMTLAYEHDPDSAKRPPPLPVEHREALLFEMIVGLTSIYRYFEPHRSAGMYAEQRRTGIALADQDPCPCGSRRMYNHCCLVRRH